MTTRIVVVGTGTDVGKTHVTCALLLAARERGLSALAYKPVATGFQGRCEDAELHARASEQAYMAPTYGFARPVSPHLAAREAGRPISIDVIRDAAMALAKTDLQVVETAGGLFTPLGPTITNVDLVRALACPIVLVAPDRLGVLHDLGATLAGARSAQLFEPIVVLSAPASPDPATGTNADELETLRIALVEATFPRAAPEARASLDAAHAVLDRCGLADERDAS
jgi:dethiobiotin synthetase